MYGVRSVYQPYAGELPELQRRIAALMAAQEGALSSPERAAREAHHLALLERDHAPRVGWSLLAVLAFLGWAASLFGLAQRGFDDETGALLPRLAARFAGLAAGLLGAWVLGLWMA